MSVDQGVIKGTLSFPSYLGVKPGDVVLVWDHPELVDSDSSAWWVGEVIVIDRSVRDSREPSLFQVADVDSGVIRWVNAGQVNHTLPRTAKTPHLAGRVTGTAST